MNIAFENGEYASILENLMKNKHIDKDNICAICRDPLLIDTIDLHCKHRYHSNCLLSSFMKYESKKCQLCNEHFLIDSYKTICQKIMKNKKVCNKKCYNNEGLCNIHIKTYLKELQREKHKDIKNKNKKEKALLKRQIKSRDKKVIKLSKELENIKMEIINLSNKLENLE